MARHPMSSSWPQLTARTSVSGQSSRLALQEDITVRTAQNTIFTDTPRRRQAAAPDKVHDTGARSLWIGVQPQVSRRSHPVPCSAIRFQGFAPGRPGLPWAACPNSWPKPTPADSTAAS